MEWTISTKTLAILTDNEEPASIPFLHQGDESTHLIPMNFFNGKGDLVPPRVKPTLKFRQTIEYAITIHGQSLRFSSAMSRSEPRVDYLGLYDLKFPFGHLSFYDFFMVPRKEADLFERYRLCSCYP